jgi:hypothetical protein
MGTPARLRRRIRDVQAHQSFGGIRPITARIGGLKQCCIKREMLAIIVYDRLAGWSLLSDGKHGAPPSLSRKSTDRL